MWRQFCLQLELCSPTRWLFQSFQICKRFATLFPTFYKSQLTGFFYFVNFVQSCFSLFFSGAQIPLHCSSNREVVSKSRNHEKCSFFRACASNVYLLNRHKSFAGLPPFLVFSLPSLSSTSVLQCSLCCLLYFLYGSR